MRGSDFKERAIHEGRRYAADRLVFLRELAQNARDAGATRLDVDCVPRDRDLEITVSDDGGGMSFRHARRYLFTLYASSKEAEPRSAGRFGVGFWSVLLYEPSRITVESCTARGGAFKIELEGDLETERRTRGSLEEPGTRITLRRPVSGRAELERLTREAEHALRRYAGCLRRNDRRATPLAVTFNGARIDRPFELDSPCWLSFRDGPVEGAVGLGDRPRVDLYARGLLVWRGTLLDELCYGAEPRSPIRHPAGLSPIYVLNGNDLDVTLDRRAVVDDEALARVRRVARRRMRELVARYLDGVAPRPLGERFRDALAAARDRLLERPSLAAALAGALLVLGVAAAVPALWLFAAEISARPFAADPSDAGGAAGGARPMREPLGNPARFQGPAVDPLAGQTALAARLSGATPPFLRFRTWTELHAGRGIQGGAVLPAGFALPCRCDQGCVDVEVAVQADPGPLVLPVPTGHCVDPDSVRVDGVRSPPLATTESGEPFLVLEKRLVGLLSYRTGPDPAPLPAGLRARMLAVPPAMALPSDLERAVRAAAALPTADRKAAALSEEVAARIRYDTTPATAAAYATFLDRDPAAGWLDFVAALGRGDCDVMSAFLVALLRRAGVPARLAAGWVVEGDRPRAGLHAWVELYGETWRAMDVTATRGPGPSRAPDGSMQVMSPAAGAIRGVSSPGDLQGTADRPLADASAPWRSVALVAAAVLALALALCAALLFAARGATPIVATGGPADQRLVAAAILRNAMSFPDARFHGAAVRHRLLPVLGSPRGMSLAEAVSRGRRGRLFRSKGKEAIFERFVERGARVLDASDPAFGELSAGIPGVVDLDAVLDLRTVAPRRLPAELAAEGRLIEAANRLLAAAGIRGAPLRPALGLEDGVFRDVDLGGLGGKAAERFVAVAVRAREVGPYARLAVREPYLAAYLLLENALEASLLLGGGEERIRRAAARRTLEVIG